MRSSRFAQASRSSSVVGACSAVVLICFGASACGHAASATCLDDGRDAVVVHVEDATTGALLCDAVVALHSGTYSETLGAAVDTEPDGAAGCVYDGALERAGTYEVDVALSGYEPAAKTNVVVPIDGCGHVVPQILVITLTHSP